MSIDNVNNEKGLFWYPSLNCKWDFDKPLDKSELLDSYIKYFLSRLQSMFIYENLPESIPQKWLEHYLLVNGSCVFVRNGEEVIATTAGVGGELDIYYIPKKVIVSNPYVKEETRKTYTIGEDCVLIRNDTYSQGLLPLLMRYCVMMVENDISLSTADIIARAMLTITAASNQDKESVDRWFSRLRRGELSAIGELPAMVGNQDKTVNITPFRDSASILTDLIEYHQYLKASLYNEIGLNANYNMKRESLNSNESQLNDDMLTPLIDDMLARRKEAIEELNEMFDLNVSVKFNSAWKENEIETSKALENLDDNNVSDSSDGISDDLIDDSNEDTVDVTPEDNGDDVPEGAESDILPEAPENESESLPLIEAIENLTEAIEDHTEAIEGDKPEDSDLKEGEE